MSYLQDEFRQTGSFLIPLRLFVGIFFVLASVSKFFDSQWHTGTTLTKVLQQQLQANAIVFPFYESFVSDMLVPNVEILSGIILFLELYSGLAILFGIFTNLALISGIALYVNLLFLGRVHPSLLLIITQTVLLGMNSGAIFGFDKVFSRRISSGILVAQRDSDPHSFPEKFRTTSPMGQNFSEELHRPKSSRFVFATVAVWFLLFALLSISYGQSLMVNLLKDPTLLLNDPTTSIIVLSFMASLTFLILAIQAKASEDERTSRETLLIQGPVTPATSLRHSSEMATVSQGQPRVDRTLNAQDHGQTVPSFQRASTQPSQQPVMDNRTLTNEFSKLIVPHNMDEAKADAKRKGESVQKKKDEENDSPALRKLYLE